MSKYPKITHVAVRFQGVVYSLPAPNRHHHVLWHIVGTGVASHVDNDEQGFLDENGTFLDRKQALVNALDNNQVKDPNDIRCNMLFSEDVW